MSLPIWPSLWPSRRVRGQQRLACEARLRELGVAQPLQYSSIRVVAGKWDWSTDCAVLSDGRAYNTGARDEPGCDPDHEHCGDFEDEPCGGGSDYLISADGEHTVRRCRARILIKCP